MTSLEIEKRRETFLRNWVIKKVQTDDNSDNVHVCCEDNVLYKY